MNLLILWAGITTGSVIYHAAKYSLGYPFGGAELFASTYWTGFALLAVYLHARVAA